MSAELEEQEIGRQEGGSKHTIEPWTSGGGVIYGGGGSCIADLVGGNANNLRSPDETEANTNLMVAAPAMLEVLKKVKSNLDLFDYAMFGWEFEQNIDEIIASIEGEPLAP